MHRARSPARQRPGGLHTAAPAAASPWGAGAPRPGPGPARPSPPRPGGRGRKAEGSISSRGPALASAGPDKGPHGQRHVRLLSLLSRLPAAFPARAGAEPRRGPPLPHSLLRARRGSKPGGSLRPPSLGGRPALTRGKRSPPSSGAWPAPRGSAQTPQVLRLPTSEPGTQQAWLRLPVVPAVCPRMSRSV